MERKLLEYTKSRGYKFVSVLEVVASGFNENKISEDSRYGSEESKIIVAHEDGFTGFETLRNLFSALWVINHEEKPRWILSKI